MRCPGRRVPVIVNVGAGWIARYATGDFFICEVHQVRYAPQRERRGDIRVRSDSPPYAVTAAEEFKSNNLEYIVRVTRIRARNPFFQIGHPVTVRVVTRSILTGGQVELSDPHFKR